MTTLADAEELVRTSKPNTITVLRTSHYNGFVHPDPPDRTASSYALASPRRDYVLTGLVVVNLAKTRRAKKLVVRFVCEARLAFPDQEWEDDVIYERTLEIGDEADGLLLEPGPQRFDFSFVVPSTIAGFDRNTYGRVTHRVDATLVGQPVKRFGGLFGGSTTPPSTSRSPSPHYERHDRSRTTGSPTGMGFGTRKSAHASPAITPPLTSPVLSPEALPSAGPSAQAKQLHDVKWLQGSMKAHKDLWILPIPSEQPEAIVLDHSSSTLVPGLGILRWSLTSDAIAVGSYVKLRAEFADALPPDANIHCIRLYIQQTISLKSPRRPEQAERTFPPVSMVVVDKGKLVPGAAPGKEKERDADRMLWTGRGGGQLTGESVMIEEVARLPDENRLRPSTCPGTITPIHMTHQFSLHVYFSIENQDVQGRLLATPGPGTLRRAEVSYPFLLPHCSCISVNFALPTYEDALTNKRTTLWDGGKNDSNFDICACGLPMSNLAERELERGRTAEERREEEEAERRGRDLERTFRKAEYESTSRGRTL